MNTKFALKFILADDHIWVRWAYVHGFADTRRSALHAEQDVVFGSVGVLLDVPLAH